jgi:agmatinase
VVLPVPFDGTSTWRKGADHGPERILEASAQLELYDIETDTEVYRRGIATAEPVEVAGPVEAMVERVRAAVAGVLGLGKLPVVLGGEHSVTIGSAWACADRYPQLSVLQLDAHSDLRDSYEGSPFNHACVMARVKERCPMVQVGIRSMDASEKPAMDRERVYFARDIVGRDDWIRPVVDALSHEVYLTVDLDVFDPAYVPATGTPEPGGLDWYAVLAVARELCARRRLVGFDVVELCPEANPASDFLAAKLVYKILTYCLEGRKE